MREVRLLTVLVAAVVAGALAVGLSGAATANCEVSDRSTEEVLPGVVLTWDSSFLCANAPDSGTYEIEVTVSNAAGSAEAVEIRELRLSHTTPRPGGRGPEATATAQGLPIVVGPGESENFRVSGTYELVSTDEGDKANLHLRALGRGVESGEPFELGINVMLRAAGAVEGGRAGTQGWDVLHGTPGDDVIHARAGNDVVYGRGGNDVIYGGRGNDRLVGGAGNDRLVGGPGRDVLVGGLGRDRLVARDGARDIVNGGRARDSARVDRLRDRLRSVETRLYR